MKVVQINVTANSGSTGRIAESIGAAAQNAGFESWIAYGRHANKSSSHLIRIGSKFDYWEHGIESRLFDNHGLASRTATASFLKTLDGIKPDLIHLHNIHGYFFNYRMFFQYVQEKNIPLVWTLHDCWAFTGHCAHFSYEKCNRWKSGCFDCPKKKTYPACYFLDRSKNNYKQKKSCFNSTREMVIVSVSQWLDDLVSDSFLKAQKHMVIRNGVDTDAFSPCSNMEQIKRKHQIRADETMVLGVTSVWSKKKGLYDFIELSKQVSPKVKIVLLGLTQKQIRILPQTIIGIERTESVQQLAEYYSAADLFLNMTYEDNYPTTNLESISCGTPCLTYCTGGSPESITPETGFVVPQGDLKSVLQCIETVQKNGKRSYSTICRSYALDHFRQGDRFQEYINLYKQILHV